MAKSDEAANKRFASSMKKCEWKKLKRRSLSLSEWQCLKCGKIGYASHDKPPINCLRTIFGVNVNSSAGSNTNLLNKITRTKAGGYSLSFVIVGLLIVGLAVFSQFKCNLYVFVGYKSAVCSSVDLVTDIYESDTSEGLRETDANTDLCNGFDYVDYEDVEEYFDMLRSEIALLDDAIKGSPQNYKQSYSRFLEMNKSRKAFADKKIYKCFGGDEGNKLALEVTRMQNYIFDKGKTLYDLSYN